MSIISDFWDDFASCAKEDISYQLREYFEKCPDLFKRESDGSYSLVLGRQFCEDQLQDLYCILHNYAMHKHAVPDAGCIKSLAQVAPILFLNEKALGNAVKLAYYTLLDCNLFSEIISEEESCHRAEYTEPGHSEEGLSPYHIKMLCLFDISSACEELALACSNELSDNPQAW